MANQQLYTLLYFAVNGQLLTEEFKVQWSRTSNSQRVNTTAKGFAGLSPGAALFEANISNAVPAAAFEYDMGPIIAGLVIVTCQLIGPGGKRIVAPGFCEKDDGSHATGSASEYNFNFVSNMQQWQ